MPIEQAILNIDVNFTNKPELIGNQYVNKNHVGLTEVKSKLKKYITVDEVLSKLNLKHKYPGQITNSTKQILPMYQKMIENDVVEPKKFSFVHIGSHCNVYTHGGHIEYEFKKELHDFESHQAFSYLFAKKYIDKMLWVHPDHYTEKQIDEHFEGLDFVKRNGYHMISINQGLRFVIKPIRWNQFFPSKYDWKGISIVADNHTANFESEDLEKLKGIIF